MGSFWEMILPYRIGHAWTMYGFASAEVLIWVLYLFMFLFRCSITVICKILLPFFFFARSVATAGVIGAWDQASCLNSFFSQVPSNTIFCCYWGINKYYYYFYYYLREAQLNLKNCPCKGVTNCWNAVGQHLFIYMFRCTCRDTIDVQVLHTATWTFFFSFFQLILHSCIPMLILLA